MAKYPHDSKRPSPSRVLRAIADGDIEAVKKALSHRQRRFAEEYVFDFDGGKAAVRAGYSMNNAGKQGYLLQKHDGVAYYIDHLTKNVSSNVTVVDPDYIISRVTEIIGKPGARDGDRLRGLELLARHLGMFIDRTEITGKDGGPIETQKVQEEAQSFNELLRQLRDRADETAANKVDVNIV